MQCTAVEAGRHMYGQPAKQNGYKQKYICILAAHWLRDYTRLIAQHGTGGALRVYKTLPRCCAVRVRPFHFRANGRSQTHSAEGKTERACSRYCFVLQKRSRLKERGGEAGGRVRRSVRGVVQKICISYIYNTDILFCCSNCACQADTLITADLAAAAARCFSLCWS
jgi:hypothetical protein